MNQLLSFLDSVDLGLLYFINVKLASSFTDRLMPFFSAYGGYLFLPWLAYEATQKDRRPYVVVFAIFSFLFADFLSGALKELICRPRPCQAFPFVRLLVNCGKSFSLPSNHAANSFAVASFLFFSRRSARWALAVAGIVALSRVFVGVHYPLDIVAGALLGVSVGYALFRLQVAVAARNQK